MSIEINTCRSCGAVIIWLLTKTGKSMPVDASSVQAQKGALIYDPEKGHISHFSTCPQAKRWKRK